MSTVISHNYSLSPLQTFTYPPCAYTHVLLTMNSIEVNSAWEVLICVDTTNALYVNIQHKRKPENCLTLNKVDELHLVPSK